MALHFLKLKLVVTIFIMAKTENKEKLINSLLKAYMMPQAYNSIFTNPNFYKPNFYKPNLEIQNPNFVSEIYSVNLSSFCHVTLYYFDTSHVDKTFLINKRSCLTGLPTVLD